MGTIIRNGIEYGGISPDIEDKINNAKGIELTQAEYDTLSEEEQKTGLYWITDADSGSSSINALTSDDVVDNLESTETKLPLSANMGREMYKNGVPFLKMTGVLNNDGSQVPPNAYKDNAMAIGYAYGISIGLNVSAYIPIITSSWYETSDVIRTTQLAITGTGIAIRYSVSEGIWSEWTNK